MPKRTAAIKAGYSPKSAGTQASQMLATQQVQDYLAPFLQREAAEVAIERDLVRRRLVGFISADLTAMFDDEWNLLPKAEIPKKVRALIQAVKKWQSEEQGTSVSVKILSQLDAIKAYLRFFPEAEKKADDLAEAAEHVETSLEELIKRLESK